MASHTPTIAGQRTSAAAEAALIEMAARLPAFHLRQAGQWILAHFAPEVADRADEAALRRAERRAHQTRGFTLSGPVDGVVRLSGALDNESAAIVDAALQPLIPDRAGEIASIGSGCRGRISR